MPHASWDRQAIIEDLLLIRADREKYYYGRLSSTCQHRAGEKATARNCSGKAFALSHLCDKVCLVSMVLLLQS